MSGASLDLQKAVYARLITSGSLTALVPATSIFDRNRRPETFPCIILGEGQTTAPMGLSRNRHEVYADLHIWSSDLGLSPVQLMSNAIRVALSDEPLTLDNHHVADLYVHSERLQRDKDGIHSHCILTLCAQLVEFA
jgi:hypothetical protein